MRVNPVSDQHIEFHTAHGVTVAHSVKAATKVLLGAGFTPEDLKQQLTPVKSDEPTGKFSLAALPAPANASIGEAQDTSERAGAIFK